MLEQTRQQELDEIIDQLNSITEYTNNYVENEDCGIAEYAQCFAYGESDKDDIADKIERIEWLSDEDKKIIKALSYSELAGICSLELVSGIWSREDEIFSCVIGEVEEQLPDELFAEIKKLNDEELEYIERNCDGYYSDGFLYVNRDYDRWSMILDETLTNEFLDNKEGGQ